MIVPGTEFNTAGWLTEGFTVYYEYLTTVRLYEEHTISKNQTEVDLLRAFNEIASADISDFFHTYVYGTKELPFLEYLKIAGLEITEIKTDRPYSGILVSPPTEKQKGVIDNVLQDSPASKA